MLITDKQLLLYQRCQRRAFLDRYGDISQQDPPSDFLLKLIRDSSAYQKYILSQYPYSKLSYFFGNWDLGAKQTIELMQQGVERIYQGILLKLEVINQSEILGDRDNLSESNQIIEIKLLSSPELLVKQPGFSKFGDWVYVSQDIKLGKRPKLDYQIISAFHAYLLADIQGIQPETSWLILRGKAPYSVDLEQRLPKMHDVLNNYLNMVLSRQEPEVFIARQKCNLCQWHSYCLDVARSQNHISLIPGVTPTRYLRLQEINLTTVQTLAKATPEQLEVYPEFAEGIALQIIKQAESNSDNKAIKRWEEFISFEKHFNSSEWIKIFQDNYQNKLKKFPVEIYFDIEAQPELNLDYLHGILVIDHRSNQQKFYPFLAENQTQEELIWKQFLELVWMYPIAPIFHFCDYEPKTIKRLAMVYHTPDYLWKPVLNRFIDLHAKMIETVTLPVESYALKPVAKWLGFEWRDPTANGAQSVCWYEQWLKTGDRSLLDAIVKYNEDDCRATFHIKEWLTEFLND